MICSVGEVCGTVDKSIRVTSLSLLSLGMLFKTQNFENVFLKECLVNSFLELRHEKLPNLLFNYGNCMMSLFSLTINKTGEIKCIQLTSVAYEPNQKWGKRPKWYALKINKYSIPIKIYLKQRDTGGTDPKTTALTTLGLSMGAKENIITFLRIKEFPDLF